MNAFTVTAIGRDHPGIVAALTGALADVGCNLEDSSMTVLRGNFAVMLVLSAPGSVDRAALQDQLAQAAESHDLLIDVRNAPVDEPVGAAGPTLTVTVHGADRPGIVHGISAELAHWEANIIDLTTRVVGPETSPLYVMALDVFVPPHVDTEAMAAALRTRASGLGVDCHVHPSEPDVL